MNIFLFFFFCPAVGGGFDNTQGDGSGVKSEVKAEVFEKKNNEFCYFCSSNARYLFDFSA